MSKIMGCGARDNRGIDRLVCQNTLHDRLRISGPRWLVARGFAEHGQETSFYGDLHGSFPPPAAALTSTSRPGIVLTPKGDDPAGRFEKAPVTG